MVAYNLRRLINIIGMQELKKYLESIFAVLCSNIKRFKLFLSHINLELKNIMKDPGFEQHTILKLKLPQISINSFAF